MTSVEGRIKPLAKLDSQELLNRVSRENKTAAKGAGALNQHDIDGAVFLSMTDDDFKEIGILSFGVRKSLIMFREKVLRSEATCNQNIPTMESQPESEAALNKSKKNLLLEPIPDNIIAGECTEEIKEDFNVFTPSPGMDYKPVNGYLEIATDYQLTAVYGECSASESGEVVPSNSEEIFNKPEMEDEKFVVAECRTRRCAFSEVGYGNEKKMQRIEYASVPQLKKNRDADVSRLRTHDEASLTGRSLLFLDSQVSSIKSTGSNKSIVLSSRSLLGKKKLRNWVFNRKVTWKENGERRSADNFMKLRNDNEIVLEGYLQMLTNVNNRFMPNHWTSRYGIILKSRVFLHFIYDSKTLYHKASTDLRLVERIEIPQPDKESSTLRFEILMNTNRRIVLGFTTESELLMWRNEIISLAHDSDYARSEEEKKK